MTLSLEQAELECERARQRLRDALIRIQTHRIDALLATDAPDVSAEVTWLLHAGRPRVVRHVLDLVENYVCATVNLDYVRQPEIQDYAASVSPEDSEPDYLKGS